MDTTYVKRLDAQRRKITEAIRELQFPTLHEGISHTQVTPFASYSPWLDDEVFMALYEKIKGNTLVDIYRCYELWSLVKQVGSLEGDIVEVGVWRGGTGAILAKAAASFAGCSVCLCDTFAGVVKASEEDTRYKGGEHADTSQQLVDDLLKSLELTNYTLYRGIFPDDFEEEFRNRKLRFCHIDVDVFSSAKGVFEFTWNNLVPGGMVVFDDYGFWGCEGVTKYFNELSVEGACKLHNLNGHGIIIKLADKK